MEADGGAQQFGGGLGSPRRKHLPKLGLAERFEERASAARSMRHLYENKNSCAFGSITDRSHLISWATPDNYGTIWAHKDELPETIYSPNIHTYGLAPDPRSPSPTKNWGPSGSFASASPRIPPPARTPYRDDIGPDTYNYAKAKDLLMAYKPTSPPKSKFGSTGTFSSTAKRFVIPAVIKKEEVESPWTLEKDAEKWTDRQLTLPKTKRFQKSPMHLPKKKQLGHEYTVDTPYSPDIATQVKQSPVTCSAAFRSSRQRFVEPKFPYARPLGPDTYDGAWFKAQAAWVRQS